MMTKRLQTMSITAENRSRRPGPWWRR
jgi:hypothetical protein